MLLAVSGLDVAFVGALAALAGAVTAPLSAWLIASQGRSHELNLDRERRLFDARRVMYESALADVAKSLATMRHAHITVGRVEGYPVEPHMPKSSLETDDWLDLRGRLSALASDEVLKSLDSVSEAMYAFWELVLRLDKDGAPPPTDHDKSELSRLSKEAHEASERLGREMRTDLAGRS